jgi:selenium metabolism protein YedF
MKKHLDLRGLSCPEPVLRTKKIIDDQAVSSVEALVDSEVNVQNLERLARSQKLFVQKERLGDHFRISMARQQDDMAAGDHQHTGNPAGATGGNATVTAIDPASGRGGVTRGGGTIIFIAKDTFGQGGDSEKDHDFSHNLINVFLQTINQSGLKPSTILLANSGVKLIDPNASTYKVLCDLREGGTTVLACGLCLDYYGLKDKVAVEQVTNMFAICEYLFAADQVLSP